MHEDGPRDRDRGGVHHIAVLVDHRIAHERRLKGVAVGDHFLAFFIDFWVSSEGMGELAVEIGRTYRVQIGQADNRRLR